MFKTVITWYKISNPEHNPKHTLPLGKAQQIHVAGKTLCLVHTKDGLKAVSDKCPHNGFSLSRGWCTTDGNAIVCPLHRYAFDLDNGRARSGFAGAVITYPVEERADGVYLGVEHTVLKWFS